MLLVLGTHWVCGFKHQFPFLFKVTQSPDCNVSMVKLRQILDDISRAMRQPTIPTLEQISQSTMTTLHQQRGKQVGR